MADAIIYTTPTWPYCKYVKEFLSRENVSYQEKNVAVDRQAAMEMVNRTGQMGVPVTVLADEAIIGFNQPALKAAVAKLRRQKGGGLEALRLGAQVAEARRVLEQQGKPLRSGALLGTIKPGSLAAKAGLQEGDIITRVNGQPVSGPEDLARALQAIQTGKISRPGLIFWRDGQELDTRLPVVFD